MTRYSIWIIGVILTCEGCIQMPPDPDPELPLETQEGLNTLGMTVNGFVFEARGGSTNNPHLDVWQSDNTLFLEAFDFIDDELFTLRIDFPTNPLQLDTGQYYYCQRNDIGVGPRIQTNSPDFEGYGLEKNLDSNIRITKVDLENRILSGSFEIDISGENNDTIRLRDGRFDVIVH